MIYGFAEARNQGRGGNPAGPVELMRGDRVIVLGGTHRGDLTRAARD